MRFLILFIFFLPQLHVSSYAQYRLKGFLGVQGGESFNYVLEFSDSLNTIKGYAYTYSQENKEVKARIEGRIDRLKQTLTFKETELIYNHGFKSKATICLIQGRLQFVKEDNDSVFKTGITTNDITDVACAKGTIVITDIAAVKNMFGEKNKTIENSIAKSNLLSKKPVKYVFDTTGQQKYPAIDQKNTVTITRGKNTSFNWQSDSVLLYIWDGGKVDGDVISIAVNQQVILDKYILKNTQKKLIIPFTEEKIFIYIISENEGNEPPNTANVLLTDGNSSYNIIAYNKIGNKATIELVKK